MSHQNKSARTTATTATGPTDQGMVTGDFWGMYISDDKLRVDSQSDMCHSELRGLQELLELAHSSATCLAPGSSSRELYLWGVLSLCMSKVESAQRSLQLRDSLLASEFAVMVARQVRRRRNEEAEVQQQGQGRAARRDGSSCEDDDDWVLVK